MSPSDAAEFIADTRDRLADATQVTQVSKRAWRLVVRRALPEGPSLIVKLWARPDLKGRIKSAFGQSSAAHEARSLELAAAHGVPVPAFHGYANLGRHASGYTEGLIMEDLGEVTEALAALKGMIAAGDEAAVAQFEAELVAMTATMIRASILDYDHSLVNIVRQPTSGRLVRLDLEQARKVRSLDKQNRLYSRMLGRFLGSYIFAVQPDTGRADRFARAVFDAIDPPTAVRLGTQSEIDALMARQTEGGGPDTRFKLPEV